MSDASFAAVCIWTGINVLLMLGLALNVTFHRFQSQKENYNKNRLDLAIRAHGNNIEYVPVILFMLWLVAYTGADQIWIHSLGGALLVARICHAHGIQQPAERTANAIPPSRIVGNLGTWLIMLVGAGILLAGGLGLVS